MVVSDGSSQVSVTLPLPAVAARPVGAAGGGGVYGPTAGELRQPLSPLLLRARTATM